MLYYFLTSHLIVSTLISRRIYRNSSLTIFQKKAHIILTFLIPVIWGIIAYNFTKERLFKTTTKKDRKRNPLGGNSPSTGDFGGGGDDHG